MSRIFVTGAAGYLGSEIVKYFIENTDHEIICLDNLLFNQKFCNEGKRVQNLIGDVRDENLMRKVLKKVDIIFPLAAYVGAPICKKYPKETEEVNFLSIKKMCEILDKDQQVIMPITNSGYGVGEKDAFCDENSPLNPISLYGRTKVDAEKVVMDRENSISFRLATVFGVSERMRVDLLVNNFTYIATHKKYLELFEPHFRRNYIHIHDICRAFKFGIDNFSILKSDIYNLGLSEANLTKFQLCEEIKKVINDFEFKVIEEGEDEDKRDYFVSNKKIENKGFKATTKLENGIKQLYEYYKNNNVVNSNV